MTRMFLPDCFETLRIQLDYMQGNINSLPSREGELLEEILKELSTLLKTIELWSDGLFAAETEFSTLRLRSEPNPMMTQIEPPDENFRNTLSEIAADLSDEILQPLTAIVAFAQACQQMLKTGTASTPMLAETLEQIASQGLRAGNVVHRILDLTSHRDR